MQHHRKHQSPNKTKHTSLTLTIDTSKQLTFTFMNRSEKIVNERQGLHLSISSFMHSSFGFTGRRELAWTTHTNEICQ